ncbi:MAG: cytochrome c3 family protein [Desulfobacterales bacterium]|nr:cytochrome c3 family protein [Desulfobacterales bacterium]
MYRKCVVVFCMLLAIISVNVLDTGGQTTNGTEQKSPETKEDTISIPTEKGLIEPPKEVKKLDTGGQPADETRQNSTEKKEYTISIPTEKRLIEPPKEVKKQRAVVGFFHSKHYTLTCIKCHHEWKGDAAIPKCSASKCHDLAKPPKKAEILASKTILEISYYKKAFHDLCIGCHQDMKRKNIEMEKSYLTLKPKIEKTGPTGCVLCHPKDLTMPGK